VRIFRRYLGVLGLFGALPAASVLVGNLAVDPFGIHRLVNRPGFNQVKPAEPDHRRMIKPYRMRHYEPRGLVLGSSRAEYALNPDHPAWSADARPVYNAALPDANPYEMRRMFQHALACGDIRQVVIGLDFYTFNQFFRPRPDFSETRLAAREDGRWAVAPVDEWISTLLSFDACVQSLRTVRGQPDTPEPAFLLPNGQQAPTPRDLAFLGGRRGLFLLTEYEYVFYKWRPEPEHQLVLPASSTQGSFGELDLLLRTAAEHGVDVRLLISPFHARLHHALVEAGHWEKFEAWKRLLVEISDRHQVPLWDFSGFNRITTEPVPAWGDTQAEMQWYSDASHYSRTLGDVVLQRVLGAQPEEGYSDFGVRLSADGLEDHLRRQREARDAFPRAFPEDAEEIRLLVRLREGNRMTDTIRDLQSRAAAHAAIPSLQ